MIYIRKNKDRGQSKIDWLTSFHTFSFADYYDSEFTGFKSLRVINEDTVQPGFGFGKHQHKDMEIISYVVEGSLEHQDSIGTGSIIRPGEIQKMTAGTGVYHSEFNHSKHALLHFLQIWILPEKLNLTPGYQQIKIPKILNQLILIGSNEKKEDAIILHQNVNLYVAYMQMYHSIDYPLPPGRAAWLQLIKGEITLNNHNMTAGDGAAIQVENIKLNCNKEAEFLLFDLSEN